MKNRILRGVILGGWRAVASPKEKEKKERKRERKEIKEKKEGNYE